MILTGDEFLSIMPNAVSRISDFINPLNDAMMEFGINTYARMAMFLAQIAHESGEFLYMEEVADGSAYDGRSDLGNTDPIAINVASLNGSTAGKFFKGHGPIQITGFYNHKSCGEALGVDAVNNPLILTKPVNGCRSAAWFWSIRAKLNEVADQDNEDAFKQVTLKINGGYNGYDQRKAYWIRAQECLGA